MIIPHIDLHEVAAPICAGTIVSLLNKYILNNPDIFNCSCFQQFVEMEEVVEDDRHSENSGQTIASVETINPHGVHYMHSHFS